jgi:hypothetical protein
MYGQDMKKPRKSAHEYMGAMEWCDLRPNLVGLYRVLEEMRLEHEHLHQLAWQLDRAREHDEHRPPGMPKTKYTYSAGVDLPPAKKSRAEVSCSAEPSVKLAARLRLRT